MVYALVLVIFFALFARLAITQFRWAVLLMAALLPAYVIRFYLGPLPSTVLEGMFIILLLVWGAALWKAQDRAARLQAMKTSLFFRPGLFLLASAAISIAWSADHIAALGIWRAYFLEPFLFYFLLIDQFTTNQDWKDLFTALGCTTLALTSIAVIQRLTGWWSPTWEWTQPGSRRVTGVFTSPNALGLFIVPVISAYVWFVARVQKQRWPLLVIAAGLLTLLLAVSKGSLLAFLPVLLILAWFDGRRRKPVLAAVGIVLILVLISPLRQPLFQLAAFETDSGQSRIQLYTGALGLLKQHPIRGLGLANFGTAFEQVRPADYTEKLIYPHDIFLNFWSETGLLGLIAVLWIIVIVARQAWRVRKQPSLVAWAFILALLPVLIHGLIDVPYFKNDLAMLTWLLLAGLTVSSRIATANR